MANLCVENVFCYVLYNKIINMRMISGLPFQEKLRLPEHRQLLFNNDFFKETGGLEPSDISLVVGKRMGDKF